MIKSQMKSNYEIETECQIKKLRAGMRFHEMFAYWVYVLSVNQKTGVVHIRTHSGHPSNPIAEHIRFHRFPTIKAAQKFIKYVMYYDDTAFKRMQEEILVTGKEENRGYADDLKPRIWKLQLVEDLK